MVRLVKRLRRRCPKGGERLLREISADPAAAGYLNERGVPFSAMSVRKMLAQRT